MGTSTAHAPLWTTTEVADFLSVPVATLYSWRQRGIGPPAISIGKYLRFDPAELRAWVDEMRRAS